MKTEIKLLSGALGAEIVGIDLTDISDENFKKINNLLLEHKVIFFRDQPITKEQQIALAEKFGPLETHAYVKGLDNYPEIVRIIKGKEEKNQWGENWHSDVSYNSKPTKAVILKSIKIPPVGGDTCFSNMELAWETLDPKIQEKIIDKKAVHSSLGAEFFIENYKYMEGNEKRNYDSYSNEHPIVRTHPETKLKSLYINPIRIENIQGYSKENMTKLIKTIMIKVQSKKFEYRHKWRKGDFVIWDNRILMHKANGDYDMSEDRYLYRIMLSGDRPYL